MSHSIKSLLSLDDNQGLFYIETCPMDITLSPEKEEEEKPPDLLAGSFKTNGRYFEDPSPLVKCYNCNEYGHMSGSCSNINYKFRCNFCGESGHTSYNCIQVICHKCFGVGHKINKCTANLNEKCRECKRIGHKAHNCIVRTKPLDNKESILISCLICREIGHANCYHIKSYSRGEYCSKCAEKGHIRSECGRR